MKRGVPLTIIDEVGSVVDVLAALGVFHGDLDELFHGGVVAMVVVFVGVKHAFGDAHLLNYRR